MMNLEQNLQDKCERRKFVNKHILILTHGNFGKELLKSLEMIVGDVRDISTVSLMPGVAPEHFQEEVFKTLMLLDKEAEVLCLVDLFGGSPCNIAMRIAYDRPMRIVSGLCLPMLIEATSQRDDLEMDPLIKQIVETSQSGCFEIKPRNS